MNQTGSDGWKGGNRRGGSRPGSGRKPIEGGLRLSGPMRIRFSQMDLDFIGQAMTIEQAPVFSGWARDTLVRHARRIIIKNQKDSQ